MNPISPVPEIIQAAMAGRKAEEIQEKDQEKEKVNKQVEEKEAAEKQVVEERDSDCTI